MQLLKSAKPCLPSAASVGEDKDVARSDPVLKQRHDDAPGHGLVGAVAGARGQQRHVLGRQQQGAMRGTHTIRHETDRHWFRWRRR